MQHADGLPPAQHGYGEHAPDAVVDEDGMHDPRIALDIGDAQGLAGGRHLSGDPLPQGQGEVLDQAFLESATGHRHQAPAPHQHDESRLRLHDPHDAGKHGIHELMEFETLHGRFVHLADAVQPGLPLPEPAEQKAVRRHQGPLHDGEVQEEEGDDLQVVADEVQEPVRIHVEGEGELRSDGRDDGPAEEQEDPAFERGPLSEEKPQRHQQQDARSRIR